MDFGSLAHKCGSLDWILFHYECCWFLHTKHYSIRHWSRTFHVLYFTISQKYEMINAERLLYMCIYCICMCWDSHQIEGSYQFILNSYNTITTQLQHQQYTINKQNHFQYHWQLITIVIYIIHRIAGYSLKYGRWRFSSKQWGTTRNWNRNQNHS